MSHQCKNIDMPKLSSCNTSIQPVPEQHTRETADPTNIQRGLINRDVFLLPLSGVGTSGLGRDQVGKGSPLEKIFFSKICFLSCQIQTREKPATNLRQRFNKHLAKHRMGNLVRQQFYRKILYLWMKNEVWVNNMLQKNPSLVQEEKRHILNVWAGMNLASILGRAHANNKVEIQINVIYCENTRWHL